MYPAAARLLDGSGAGAGTGSEFDGSEETDSVDLTWSSSRHPSWLQDQPDPSPKRRVERTSSSPAKSCLKQSRSSGHLALSMPSTASTSPVPPPLQAVQSRSPRNSSMELRELDDELKKSLYPGAGTPAPGSSPVPGSGSSSSQQRNRDRRSLSFHPVDVFISPSPSADADLHHHFPAVAGQQQLEEEDEPLTSPDVYHTVTSGRKQTVLTSSRKPEAFSKIVRRAVDLTPPAPPGSPACYLPQQQPLLHGHMLSPPSLYEDPFSESGFDPGLLRRSSGSLRGAGVGLLSGPRGSNGSLVRTGYQTIPRDLSRDVESSIGNRY